MFARVSYQLRGAEALYHQDFKKVFSKKNPQENLKYFVQNLDFLLIFHSCRGK